VQEIENLHRCAQTLAVACGYVCGVTWDVFRKAVENYRRWLVATSGGTTEIRPAPCEVDCHIESRQRQVNNILRKGQEIENLHRCAHGYVCGVTWDVFRKAVENYRRWLVATSGGTTEIKRAK
jgi:hypothetical protein